MPAVTVCSKPSGLPIAIAISPRRSSAEQQRRQRAARHAVDAQHRKVGVGVVADPAGIELAPVAE